MYSISTSWNAEDDFDVLHWLKEIKKLGIQSIELSYTLTKKQLDAFEKHISDLDISVSSIHNFCPAPDDEPSARHISNYYRLSSTDRHEREKAVYWTKKCIDTAVRVKSPVVIIHAGTIDVDEDPSSKLLDLYKNGKKSTDDFRDTRSKVFELREASKGRFIEVLNDSLTQVVHYAHDKGVKIGLETRYYPMEIPNFEEIGFFLNQFSCYGMGYWHDVGHAEVNERLGIRSHMDFINTYKEHLLGVHLHGVNTLRDHLAPFDGDMNLEPLLAHFKGKILKVIEARYANTEQMASAIRQLTS